MLTVHPLLLAKHFTFWGIYVRCLSVIYKPVLFQMFSPHFQQADFNYSAHFLTSSHAVCFNVPQGDWLPPGVYLQGHMASTTAE